MHSLVNMMISQSTCKDDWVWVGPAYVWHGVLWCKDVSMKQVIRLNSPARPGETIFTQKTLNSQQSLADDWNSFPHSFKDLHCPLEFSLGISLTTRLRLETPFVALESSNAMHFVQEQIIPLTGSVMAPSKANHFFLSLTLPPSPLLQRPEHCLLQLCLVPHPDGSSLEGNICCLLYRYILAVSPISLPTQTLGLILAHKWVKRILQQRAGKSPFTSSQFAWVDPSW